MPKPSREEELLAQLESLVTAVHDMGEELQRITAWVDQKIAQEQRDALRAEIRAEIEAEQNTRLDVAATFFSKWWKYIATTGVGGSVTIWAALGGHDGIVSSQRPKTTVVQRGVAPRTDDRSRTQTDHAGQKLHRAATPDAPTNER